MNSNLASGDTDKFPVIAIVGPTGSGKTEAAIHIALAVGGEIINADAFQVYKGMDIGTAKPTRAEQSLCKFHLIDLVGPCETFSASDWRSRAEAAIEDVNSRNLIPIICGGAGMYIRALLNGWSLADSPRNEALRDELRARAASKGVESVHTILAELDPSAAAKLHPNDLLRVIRAIEVYKSTGRPISQLHDRDRNQPSRYSIAQFGLMWPRSELYSRINNRVISMIESGFSTEVQRLLDGGVTRQCPGMRSLGYLEVADMVQGLRTKEEVVAAVSLKTRQYAKRQITWFKPDESIRWVQPNDPNYLNDMLTEIKGVLAN